MRYLNFIGFFLFLIIIILFSGCENTIAQPVELSSHLQADNVVSNVLTVQQSNQHLIQIDFSITDSVESLTDIAMFIPGQNYPDNFWGGSRQIFDFSYIPLLGENSLYWTGTNEKGEFVAFPGIYIVSVETQYSRKSFEFEITTEKMNIKKE